MPTPSTSPAKRRSSRPESAPRRRQFEEVLLSGPVYPAVRHVRLTAAHVRVLFGDRPLQGLLTFRSGVVASDGVVDVNAGPGDGVIKGVRILLPVVSASEVHLLARDAEVLGLPRLTTDMSRAPGCTLRGPAGVVVLAGAVVAAERVVGGAGADTAFVDVEVDGERPRLHRRIGLVPGDVEAAWIEDDTFDLTPSSRGRWEPH